MHLSREASTKRIFTEELIHTARDRDRYREQEHEQWVLIFLLTRGRATYLGLERYPPWIGGLPTLDGGEGYLPWIGEGVPTLDGGVCTYLGQGEGVPTLD